MLESHKKGEAGRLEGKRTTELFFLFFFCVIVSLRWWSLLYTHIYISWISLLARLIWSMVYGLWS